MSNANGILKKAFKAFKKRHGFGAMAYLSKVSKLPYSTVYNAITTDRQVNAETWYRAMSAMGYELLEKNQTKNGGDNCGKRDLDNSVA